MKTKSIIMDHRDFANLTTNKNMQC